MVHEALDYQDRIVTDPQILVGKPTVKGTRISVERVLEYLAVDPNFDDLFTDYPNLTMEDIQACLAYAQAKIARVANGNAHKGASLRSCMKFLLDEYIEYRLGFYLNQRGHTALGPVRIVSARDFLALIGIDSDQP